MAVTARDIVQLASERTFDSPLVMNVFRSVLVEAIVSRALPDWRWCSADYAAYDFEHEDKTRLEVKQAACRQTWTPKRPSPPSWDIKPRTGAWLDGATWIPGVRRNADLYVLGLHPIMDDSADHRDPSQWLFYVLPTSCLPDIQRLSLARASKLTEPIRIEQLADKVEQVKNATRPRRNK